MKTPSRSTLLPRGLLRELLLAHPGKMLLGAALSALTVVAGMALLGLSGWFVTATSIAEIGRAHV